VLFWLGLVVLIVEIASQVVPTPHTDWGGITIGDVSIGWKKARGKDIAGVPL